MNQTVFNTVLNKDNLTSLIVALFPIGLWMVMWLSISPGSVYKITNPGNPAAFANGLRTLFPFAAILISSAVILAKLHQRRPSGFGVVSPMGLVVLYGLVGLIAIFQSADGFVALRWTLLYLSVPIALAAIAWGTDPVVPMLRVINFTWLVIILAATALFAVALLKLELFENLSTVSSLLDCSHGNWYDLTAGKLRDTGVGRYSAIAAILAVSGLWQRRWRSMWPFVLLISGILLIYSGSRGAYGGFVAGATLVVLAHGGKKAVGVATVAVLLLAPLVWVTGTHQNVLEHCIFRGLISSQTSPRPIVPATPVETQPSVSAIIQEQADSRAVQESQASVETDAPGSKNQQSPGAPAVPGQQEVPAGSPVADIAPEEKSNPPGVSPPAQPPSKDPLIGLIPRGFFSFTGRAPVWVDAWDLLKHSPFIGYGFHADRIILNKHMHNALMQALIQTGIVGTAAFVAAMLYGWVLVFRLLRNMERLPYPHKHVFIQTAAVLAFLSMRSFPESTGAFFGVDWLILAPILFYLHVIHRSLSTPESSA